MKTVDGFTLRRIANEKILVPEGMNLVNYNKMISLNSTAAFLWEQVEGKEFTAQDLEKLLLDNYEVTPEIVRTDVQNIIASFKEAGVITD